MHLSGLHLLLTYRCLFECAHCFVWSSPRERGVMSAAQVRTILDQADALGTVETIFFEGGEPFLHYPVLLEGARSAKQRGYRVGIVSNGYWATDAETARVWLAPFAGLLDLLQLSDDRHHGGEEASERVAAAVRQAEALGIAASVIRVPLPEEDATGSLKYRGRAAAELSHRAQGAAWETFTECPHEDFHEPGRVHVDPGGEVHVCQGISLGNLFETPLAAICAAHDPEDDPVLGPLARGGPAELARTHGVVPDDRPADACHLCYETRKRLRRKFPKVLTPRQVYGEPDAAS